MRHLVYISMQRLDITWLGCRRNTHILHFGSFVMSVHGCRSILRVLSLVNITGRCRSCLVRRNFHHPCHTLGNDPGCVALVGPARNTTVSGCMQRVTQYKQLHTHVHTARYERQQVTYVRKKTLRGL